MEPGDASFTEIVRATRGGDLDRDYSGTPVQ